MPLSPLKCNTCIVTLSKHSFDKNCSQCIIINLREENSRLKDKLRYFENKSSQILKLDRDYSKRFTLSDELTPIYIGGSSDNLAGLTITFDPAKFGQYNKNSDEQNYIFYTLDKALNDQIIDNLTGCFEYQENGTTHAHILIDTQVSRQQVENYFKLFYTDRPNNKRAVKCLPAKFPGIIDYMKKESNEFFCLNPYQDDSKGLDYGLDMPIRDNELQKVEIIDDYDLRLIKCIALFKTERDSIDQSITKYNKLLNSRRENRSEAM